MELLDGRTCSFGFRLVNRGRAFESLTLSLQSCSRWVSNRTPPFALFACMHMPIPLQTASAASRADGITWSSRMKYGSPRISVAVSGKVLEASQGRHRMNHQSKNAVNTSCNAWFRRMKDAIASQSSHFNILSRPVSSES